MEMKKGSAVLYVILLLLASNCTAVKNSRIATRKATQTLAGGKLFTAVWMQQSAEYKALCLQAFSLADFRLQQILSHQRPQKPWAIITDIDETFLDNSPYAIHQALRGQDFDPATWDDWVSKAEADSIAGSLRFFKKAASQGVTIFYVTNRNQKGRAATLRNLQKFGYPNADSTHLMTMGEQSSKEQRRQLIAKDYTIALLLGDNLTDFSGLFDNHPNASERSEAVTTLKESFGRKFILLPNPNYGDWENAIYRYQHAMTPEQKVEALKKAGKTYP